jgi:hypothetical protein
MHTSLPCWFSRAAWFALVVLAAPTRAAEPLQPIFDGQSLNGWRAVGDARFDVVDGAIRGSTGGGGYGWLCTGKSYGDFVLELELKIIAGNSGIQIRSHLPDGKTMVGYQIEGDPSPRAWSGGLYEQGRRAWLQNLTNNPAARAAFKTNAWNHYLVVCEGARIQSWVNGVAATDYLDALDLDGLIALQVHSGKGVEVWFRNLRLADNGRHRWKPLWDGKTLGGWHLIGKGDWQVTGGAICASHAAGEAEFGHAVSDGVFGDFTARLTYKAVRGNSGFYFHIEEKGFSGVSGFQAEIDPNQDAGGLYETNGRSWVSKPAAEDVKKWYRPNAWNTMTVHAYGRRVAVDVNGHRTAELQDDPGRPEGRFALQVHGGQDCEICFKDLEILEKVK